MTTLTRKQSNVAAALRTMRPAASHYSAAFRLWLDKVNNAGRRLHLSPAAECAFCDFAGVPANDGSDPAMSVQS